jgi:hypothetical protein
MKTAADPVSPAWRGLPEIRFEKRDVHALRTMSLIVSEAGFLDFTSPQASCASYRSLLSSILVANMQSLISFRMLLNALLILTFSAQILAATTRTSAVRPTSAATSTRPSTPPVTSQSPVSGGGGSSTTPPQVDSTSTPPDVYLNVPELHVGRIELDVEELQADINLNAKVASLVTLNAGVQVSVQKINVTIADVDANLELIVRLGHLVDIVERVFESLDLNPLLIGLVNNVTNLVGEVIGAVDGLLGSVTQGGKTLNFLVGK